MTINELIESIKQHSDYDKVGMILCHNGVVRSTSREGRTVSGLRVKVDHKRLEAVLRENRNRPGIVDIVVHIEADRDLKVGDDVMLLAVAGDIRENVLKTMAETLNAIKTSVTHKTEFFTGTKD